jgi:molecular chaperone DnaJ
MVQAALGARVSVETMEEPTDVAVEPGTHSGHVIRLKGSGVPHLRGRGRGDLYVHVVVDTPTELTPKQEELLVQLAAERGEELGALEGTDGVFSRIRSVFG